MPAGISRASSEENVSSTLSAGITDVAVTMDVGDASKLQSPCYLVIDRVDAAGTLKATSLWEYVKVTNIATNTLTITRAQGGSTGQAHSSGAVVEAVSTAALQEEYYAALNPEHTSTGGHTVDVISEKTAATGVTIDGVKLKDSEPYTDAINEKTGGAGVTVDGVLLKDSEVTTDVINEKTGAAGVTIDSLLIKDGDIPNARLSSKVISASRVLTAAAGDVVYTGVGFKPTSIICFSMVNGVNKPLTMGFADSARNTTVIMKMATDNFNNFTTLIYAITSAGNYQTAIVKSYDDDGFTLTWTKTGSPEGTLELKFLCFK